MKYVILTLAFLFSFSSPAADEGDPSFVIHLLSYVRKDYEGAVENGKVKAQSEYDEQKEFVGTILATANTIPVLKNDPSIASGLTNLKNLVWAMGPSDKVAAQCAELQEKVKVTAKVATSPLRWPSPHKGKELYDQNCQRCHGANGFGDGPSGGNLDPKPTDFHDTKLSSASPYDMYNTIKLGVPGTGMASFASFKEEELWDLAYYVLSLRHPFEGKPVPPAITLQQASAMSDDELVPLLDPKQDAKVQLSNLRNFDGQASGYLFFLGVSRNKLSGSVKALEGGNQKAAKQLAVEAYLDGIEPIEPQLRSRDLSLVSDVEAKMAEIRMAIDANYAAEKVNAKISELELVFKQIENTLSRAESSPTFAFTMALGIVFREAFEAILIVVTLLSLLKSIGSKQATSAVHAGWVAAIGVGVMMWGFSGWLVMISGASRETLEGGISLFAVVVLLYFGFWLHRKTEMGKWRAFLDQMAKSAVGGSSLLALATVSFMAVFREAFGTVLFLRALVLEVDVAHQWFVGAGVIVSLVLTILLAAALLKFSVKVPIRQLFGISSLIMLVLSFILIGKAFHAFQETGLLSMTLIPYLTKFEWIGFYPTYETAIAQVILLAGCVFIWFATKRPRLEEQPA